eukprot:TRINITY_DN26437_c0_g3_i1.p1 TRINITY_DN26437_c0_g3~~TRINITY_DN26437_c0_g3_i1.p1  ORF type:complete len:113 (-),score=5.50 TRINITY_DN26437_c0_g3_i1:134-472(-)
MKRRLCVTLLNFTGVNKAIVCRTLLAYRGTYGGILAMNKLGGEATVPELIECCRSDTDLQEEFGGKLCMHLTKVSNSIVELPMWERSVIYSMPLVFRTSDVKRNDRKVYVVR